MRHPKITELDRRFKALFDEVDDFLEQEYGSRYILHPSRPAIGETSNKEADGLFNIGADFTPGFGSKLGRGYLVRIHMSTLEHVPAEEKQRIEADVVQLTQKKLQEFFPNQDLHLEKDGKFLKIVGDFRVDPVVSINTRQS